MDKLKAADNLYTEYTLEEIIYQLAKVQKHFVLKLTAKTEFYRFIWIYPNSKAHQSKETVIYISDDVLAISFTRPGVGPRSNTAIHGFPRIRSREGTALKVYWEESTG